jgi:hypothetical protein
MKLNKLLLILIIVFYSIFTKGQEKLTFGIHGGINYSSLRFEDNEISEHDSELSYLIGLSTKFYLKEKLYLDIELNYERKKVSVYVDEFTYGNSFGGDFRVFDIYEFLTLPIMLRYEIGEANPFFVKGGPFLGYFLTAKERVNKGKLSQDLSQYFTDFDFGFSIGIGKTFSMGNSNKLVLELRNNLGLTPVNSDSRSQYIKTNSLNFIVGCNFVL